MLLQKIVTSRVHYDIWHFLRRFLKRSQPKPKPLTWKSAWLRFSLKGLQVSIFPSEFHGPWIVIFSNYILQCWGPLGWIFTCSDGVLRKGKSFFLELGMASNFRGMWIYDQVYTDVLDVLGGYKKLKYRTQTHKNRLNVYRYLEAENKLDANDVFRSAVKDQLLNLPYTAVVQNYWPPKLYDFTTYSDQTCIHHRFVGFQSFWVW